jgi:uncharacterized protein YcbX
MRIAAVNVYPVKALGGVSLDAAAVESRGLAGDRRAMIVDAAGRFVTQRALPALAAIRVAPEDDGFTLTGPSGSVRVATPQHGRRRTVTVWGDRVDAVAGEAAVDAVLWRWLGEPVSLVHMDDVSRRPVDPQWQEQDAEVSFADGFPLLVAGTASLAQLNRRMADRGAAPVPMDRFRPNIVVETDEPFLEDRWARIAVGDVVLDLVKPCTRCVVTTTDQKTGRVATDNEPLATLATFRRSRDPRTPGVMFGWNAVPRATGRLAVGDTVSVVETRAPWPVG